MQENVQPAVQNEPLNTQINSPMPAPNTSVARENAFKYPEEQKAPVQFNSAPHKIKPFLLILLIIIFLLIIGIVLWKFVFGENIDFLSKFRAVPSPTPTIVVVTPSLVPTVNPTAGWKTYKNEKYGFEFKYPQAWYLYEPTGLIAYSKNTVGFWPKKGEGEVQGVWVTIHDDKIQFSDLNDWWEKYKKLAMVNFKAEDHNISNLQIDRTDAIKDETRNTYPSRPYTAVYMFKNGEIYELNTNIMVNGQIDYPLFFQIVSTFKFTEKTADEEYRDGLKRCGTPPVSSSEIKAGDHFRIVGQLLWSSDCKHIAWSVWQTGAMGMQYNGPYEQEGLFLYTVETKQTEKIYFLKKQETVEIRRWIDTNKIIFSIGQELNQIDIATKEIIKI